MHPDERRLIEIWFALDEGLLREIEDAENCARLKVERTVDSVATERIYRHLLKRFFKN